MAGQSLPGRLAELEQRFERLAGQLPESPQKDAVSILHGMIQEVWRTIAPTQRAGAPAEKAPVDVANLYRLAPSMGGTAENEPLSLRTTAPDFTLRDANDTEVSLSDFRGRPVVLAFYPLDWSPTCSDQLSLYEAEKAEFERFGAQVIGVSVDSIYSHGAWAAVRGITFPLLSDFEPKGAVSRRYHAYRAKDGFSERALYVIDGDGVIRYAHISPQLDRIPDIYELFDCLAEITGRPVPAKSGDERANGDRRLEQTLAGVEG